MKHRRSLVALLVLIAVACTSLIPISPAPTQWSSPTSNPTEAPSSPLFSTPTHDELERALAGRVHWESNAVCEWEVIGQEPQTIYVWAYCQSVANDSAVSAPAVIHLGSDGHVQSVDMPRDGTSYGPDVRALFPAAVQQRIFDQAFDAQGMATRLAARRALLLPKEIAPTPSPTVTPALPASTESPIAIAAAIRFESWSPTSDWLAYWSSTEADVASNSYPFPPGTLRFFNARTNQTCAYSTFVARDYRDRLVWRSDGQVIILSGGRAHIGKPCDKDFKPIEYDEPDVIVEPESALSPNGTYRATTIARLETAETFSVTTTITQVGTGQVKNTIEWRHPGGSGGLGLGGQWLTDDQFLIHETLDRGPLLISVGGDVVQVAPQLFGSPPVINSDREDFVGLRAVGAVVTGTATYHMLIAGVGSEAGFPWVKLYHSESGEVEELPFRYLWTPGFSSDGRWLLLDKPVYQDNREQRALLIRSSDPVGSEARLFTEDAAYAVWTSDWTKVAFSSHKVIAVYTFPDGQSVGSWVTDYEVAPVAWSPTNGLLVAVGYVPGLDWTALFVIHQK